MAGLNNLTYKIGSLADNVANYVKMYNSIHKTNYRSLLAIPPEIKATRYGVATDSHTSKFTEWSKAPLIPAPTTEYKNKGHIYIDKIFAYGKKSGTEEIKDIVRKSLADPDCEGRVVLTAEKIDSKKGHPFGFYYKLGFRSVDERANKYGEKWLKLGGKKEQSLWNIYKGRYISCGISKGCASVMYLPKENIQHCLNYKSTPSFRLYNPTSIVEKNGQIVLSDSFGNICSSARIQKNVDGSLNIVDIVSQQKGKFFATEILDYIKEKYNGLKIELSVLWDKTRTDRPPHSFFNELCFMFEEKEYAKIMREWQVKKGGNPEDFPEILNGAKMIDSDSFFKMYRTS